MSIEKNHSYDHVETKSQVSQNLLDEFQKIVDQESAKRHWDKIISINKLYEAKAHLSVSGKYWNPKSQHFLKANNNKLCKKIFDLSKTLLYLKQVYYFILAEAKKGRKVLFVSTDDKADIKDFIKQKCLETNSYFVNNRWLGGTLTNFKTINLSIKKFNNLLALKESEDWKKYSKKEQIAMQKQIDKLDKFIGGIAPITRSSIAGRYANNVNLNNAIGLMIVDDYVREKNAIIDAKKLGIPVVALGNSNCFPGDNVDFFIPCNTNSYHTIWLIFSVFFDAINVANGKQPVVVNADDTSIRLPENKPRVLEEVKIISNKKITPTI